MKKHLLIVTLLFIFVSCSTSVKKGMHLAPLSKESIEKAVNNELDALNECYINELGEYSYQDKVSLNWKITDTGKVLNPKIVSSSLNNSKIKKCLINVIQSLRMPKARKNELAEVVGFRIKFESLLNPEWSRFK